MNTLGSRIRYARKQKGITQLDFEREVGISSGNLSQIENDKVNPTASKLLDIRRMLGVSIDWLLTGEGDMILGNHSEAIPRSPWHLTEDQLKTANTYFPDLTEEQVALLNNFEKLDARDKREIKEIIRMKLGDTMGLSSSSEGHNGASGIA